jgi:hypothetical protein
MPSGLAALYVAPSKKKNVPVASLVRRGSTQPMFQSR